MDDFEQRWADLERTLDDLITLLTRCGERHWAGASFDAGTLIGSGEALGLDKLVSFFGGMGSLNDLVLHPSNGHTIDPASIETVNSELAALRSDVYRLVVELAAALGQ